MRGRDPNFYYGSPAWVILSAADRAGGQAGARIAAAAARRRASRTEVILTLGGTSLSLRRA